jgi:hypothetical protein
MVLLSKCSPLNRKLGKMLREIGLNNELKFGGGRFYGQGHVVVNFQQL